MAAPYHEAIEKVLDIAEDLKKNNKIIQIDLLYKIARRKLKIEAKNLFFIINYLINNKIIVEGTKFLKRDILKNQHRFEIYQFIKTYPGVHFSVIKKKILPEGGAGQFIFHLDVLLKFDFIKKVDVKNYSLFLPYDMDEQLGIFYFLLRDKINRKILKYLKDIDPAQQSDIYNNVAEKKGSVIYHINTLEEFKLVYVKEIDTVRGKLVAINPEKKELLLKISSDIESSKF